MVTAAQCQPRSQPAASDSPAFSGFRNAAGEKAIKSFAMIKQMIKRNLDHHPMFKHTMQNKQRNRKLLNHRDDDERENACPSVQACLS